MLAGTMYCLSYWLAQASRGHSVVISSLVPSQHHVGALSMVVSAAWSLQPALLVTVALVLKPPNISTSSTMGAYALVLPFLGF